MCFFGLVSGRFRANALKLLLQCDVLRKLPTPKPPTDYTQICIAGKIVLVIANPQPLEGRVDWF
jgi:hypothetical protein